MMASQLQGRNKTEDQLFLFDCLDAANDFIKCHEIETNTRFVIGQVTKNFGVNPSIRKVTWFCGPQPYMYVILGRKLLRCQHGPDKNKKQKFEKAKTREDLRNVECVENDVFDSEKATESLPCSNVDTGAETVNHKGLKRKAAGLGHLDISSSQQVGLSQSSIPGVVASESAPPGILVHMNPLMDDSQSNIESENESTRGNEIRRKTRGKRRKTVDKSPTLIIMSFEEDELECQLDLPNKNSVSFKFALEIDKPEEIADRLVSEDLLMEIQASCVILLLQKAVSMVRADPRAANGVTLAMVDTPTSSPTLPCREVRLTKGKKVATKAKKKSTEPHTYAKKKTRNRVKPSKKKDCPAAIYLKEVLIFYPEEGTTSELDKKMAAASVRSDMSKGIKKIMVVFPNIKHENHPIKETMNSVNSKCRAYQCKYCTHIDRKSRIEGHILKEHVPMDRAPYYCTLCEFRCQNKSALLKHITQYSRHVSEEQRLGKPDYTQVLRRAKHPFYVTEADMVALSAEESGVWFNRNKSQFEDLEEDEDETVFKADGSMVPLWLVKPMPAPTNLPKPILHIPETPRNKKERSSQIFTAEQACGILASPQVSAPLDTVAVPETWLSADFGQGVDDTPTTCLQTTVDTLAYALMTSSEIAVDNTFQPVLASTGPGMRCKSTHTPVQDEGDPENQFMDFLGDGDVTPVTPRALKRPIKTPSGLVPQKVQQIVSLTKQSCPTSVNACQCSTANVLKSLYSAMDEQMKVSLATQRSVAKVAEEVAKISKQLVSIQEAMAKERRSPLKNKQ
ncbi:uncharacterized protein LOC127844546 isoform X2 [Dreissena polymorpha]|uniref:uncharacterized protein LOC127844546 isoform X2 n=1 Tax=Dreissena polymorpha TaxID=45954 RepID=UPI002265308B|nr:uncharacterized protein LOC127844546 isoform X2 [Dreissena polymorpha]